MNFSWWNFFSQILQNSILEFQEHWKKITQQYKFLISQEISKN